MFKTLINVVTVIAVLWVATDDVIDRSAEVLEAAVNRLVREVQDRDKRGTTAVLENDHGSQMAENKPNTSRVSFEAEGMGFEPTTPLLGHHISSVAAGQFAYPPGVGRAFIVAGIRAISKSPGVRAFL